MMNEEELSSIESSLEITLPNAYRELMRNYPFASNSDAAGYTLCNVASRLVEETKYYREHGFFGQRWPETYFVIGNDGTGNPYFLDLALEKSPVFCANHEDTCSCQELCITEEEPDLACWVGRLEKENAEFEKMEAQRVQAKANKRWWQFWR